MDMLQRGIGPQYAGAFHFRENIIRAVRGHPAFVAGLINTPEDTSGLVANLHSSIINYEAVHKTPHHGTYMLSYNNEEEEDEMYFVDRHYRGGRPSFRGRGRFYGRPRGGSSRGQHRPSVQRQKKCFVCEKVGCWSTNHTQQERDNSRKKFEAARPHVRSQPNYEKAMQYYIHEYEGDNPDKVTEYFDQLILDITDDEKYNSPAANHPEKDENQQFFTSIGPLASSESSVITEVLNNKAFLHCMTIKDEPTPPLTPVFFTFNTVTESRYNDTKFKSLLVDFGVSMKSTGGLS